MLGTLYYMPPEQADGRPEDADERSDVYALGATLYELLTLLPPVSGATAEEILTKILRGEIEGPAERTPHRSIPRELDAVVRKAMAFDPGERYESVEAFREDLDAFMEGRTLLAASYSLPQVAAKWVARHRVLAGGSVAAVLAAVLLAGYVGWRDRAARSARAEAAVREAEELLAAAPAFQEDGIGSSVEEDAASPEAVQARRGRENALEVHLAAESALGRALAEFSDDARIRALRRRVGEELGRIALAGKDYTLARQSFRDLADHGARTVEVEALLEEVDRAQTETLRRRAERLREILADVASEDFRRGRSPGRANIEDHVLEAAGYREIQTVAIRDGGLADPDGGRTESDCGLADPDGGSTDPDGRDSRLRHPSTRTSRLRHPEPQLLTLQKLPQGESDVPSNLPKQGGRDVTTRVKRNRRASAIRVSVLPMRPALPNLFEAEAHQETCHFTGLQNRDRAHAYATRMV